MKRHPLVRLGMATAFAWASAAGAGAAWAQGPASTAMAVSVEISSNCTVAAEPLAFGTVSAAQAPSTGTSAAIEVSCGGNVPFTVSLDNGQNYGDGTRRAIDPVTGRYLSYEIYSDPAHTSRWGAVGAETGAHVTDADGAARLTAYGAIASGAALQAGTYGDLITVTTNF